MPANKINIEQFIQLSAELPVFDVRSPGEFNHAHIPGAFSLPLFTNDQRKVVGTLYKQEGRQLAIKKGLDYFGPNMKAIVEETESIIEKYHSNKNNSSQEAVSKKQILVHCWRGGMRSEAIAWLLDLYGFKVYTLIGGYKSYRNYVLDIFKFPYKLKILGGYTGSGKTALLKALEEKGERVIDLEFLANHKGSAFGHIGMQIQPSQEMFENLLAIEILRLHANHKSDDFTIWLEDESQRIGLVNVPTDLWKNMRQSPVYFLDIPFEARLSQVTSEYGILEPDKLIAAIERISQKLGSLNANTAISLLKQGQTAESFRILLAYYDKFYLKALHNREAVNTLLHKLECKSITPENANQLATNFSEKI